ncbi:MAG: TonB C-terminal domain-containing protein [Desulfatibacillaceae bacterium]
MSNPHLFYKNDPSENAAFVKMAVVSVCIHVLAALAVVLLPAIAAPRPTPRDVIPVQLVSSTPANLPKPVQGGNQAPEPAKTKVAEPAPRPEPAPEADPIKPAEQSEPAPEAEPIKPAEQSEPAPQPKSREVAAKPKPKQPTVIPDKDAEPPEVKKKTSLKRRTYNSDTVLDNALDEIAKRVKDNPNESLRRSIDEMRKRQAAGQEQSGPSSTVAVGTGSKARTLQHMQLYNIILRQHVNKNWAFPEQLVGPDEDLVAVIMVTIRRDGGIKDKFFDQRSGNPHFDNSIFRAVEKSNPMPPLPEAWEKDTYTIGLKFDPESARGR